MADRRYFKDRSNQIGRDNITLDGYQIVQLKSCIQFDGVNCGVICLKVYYSYSEYNMHSLHTNVQNNMNVYNYVYT